MSLGMVNLNLGVSLMVTSRRTLGSAGCAGSGHPVAPSFPPRSGPAVFFSGSGRCRRITIVGLLALVGALAGSDVGVGIVNRNLGRPVLLVGPRVKGSTSLLPSPCTRGAIVIRLCCLDSRDGFTDTMGSAQLTLGSLVVHLDSVPPHPWNWRTTSVHVHPWRTWLEWLLLLLLLLVYGWSVNGWFSVRFLIRKCAEGPREGL